MVYRPMNLKIALLQTHSVEYRLENGRLYALDISTNADFQARREWVEVGVMSIEQLRRWLGY